jgi:hypothetical protein
MFEILFATIALCILCSIILLTIYGFLFGNIFIKSYIFIVVSLMMFDWGYTQGGYYGMEEQASYTRFKFSDRISSYGLIKGNEECYNLSPKALHQYTPFPQNLIYSLTHFKK